MHGGLHAMTTTSGARDAANLAYVPIRDIRPNPDQARKVFDPDALEELAASIRQVGVLQPILLVTDPENPAGWMVVAGERRFRAAGIAGLDAVPALIKDASASQVALDSLMENLHRADLNPLEEGAGYKSALDDFGYTQQELATLLHVSRARISHAIGLLRLPPDVQTRVAAGVLSFGHARALCGVTSTSECSRLAAKIVAEGLSVRAVEELIALGEAEAKPPRAKATASAAMNSAHLADFTDRLTDHLDTRVKIVGSARRGRIVVEYAGEADLARLVDTILPRRTRAY